jgi:hypothetical protein
VSENIFLPKPLSEEVVSAVAFGINALVGLVLYLLAPYGLGVLCMRQFVSEADANNRKRLEFKKLKQCMYISAEIAEIALHVVIRRHIDRALL